MGNFLNSEIIGKPWDHNMAVFFARDVIDQFELDQNIDKVEIKKSQSGTTGSNPIEIYIKFKNNDYQENQIESYLERNVKRTLSNYEHIRLHINEPVDQPLNYTLSKNNDGSYLAVISTLAIPRHATQVYEALTSLLLAFLLFWLWSLRKSGTPHGLLFGLFLIILFGLRFFHELFKENQVDFENAIPMNMGQWLSIPLVLVGIYVFLNALRKGSPQEGF
jgi:prolipoprotein diacylglyceryltransferase